MHQMMHAPYTLAPFQDSAMDAVRRRGFDPFAAVPVTDPFGRPVTANLYEVEADIMLCLVERLRKLGVLE